MKKIHKIIDALTVLNTDKREESISSIIKYTLFSLGKSTSISELIEFIALEYEIKFHEEEIREITSELLTDGSLQSDGDKIYNSTSANEEIRVKQLENNTAREKSFSQFQNSFKTISNSDIPFEQLKNIHNIFLEYLNECFYVYGKSAINFFKPFEKKDDQEIISRKKILDNALGKLKNTDHKRFFEEYIKVFSTLLTNDEELFLERLADKTEYFFALGLPKDLFDEIQNINPINLDLYLDTNVLLSILNLRKHTSNEACIKLIRLINDNSKSLNISVHYTNQTYNELKRTKNELEDLVSKVELDVKVVQAGLKTDKIDSYTSSYYEEFVKYGSSVKHPTEKLKRAIEILTSHGVIIDRGEYNELLESEDFKDELSSYNQFQKIKNEARTEMNLPPRREKDIYKVEHDVLVREVILKKRKDLDNKSSNDLMSNRYYGLTLDKILIDFDRYSLRKKYLNEDVFVPTFFAPTYLLKKLYKYLPIQSDDYRKAFISAISSPVFEDNRATSKSVQDTLKDFHALGISDHNFIVKCLTNDYFLDEVKTKREENFESLKIFVENELQKGYNEVLKEKEEKEIILHEVEVKNIELKSEKALSEDENKKLREKEKSLKNDVENLGLSLKSLKKQIEKFTEIESSHSLQYNLEDKEEIEILKKQKGEVTTQYQDLKQTVNQTIAKGKLLKWKIIGWISLLFSVLVLFVFLLAFILQDWEFNYVAKLLDWAETLKDMRKEIIKLVLTALFGFTQYLLFSIFYNRVISKERIDTKYKKILDEINNT
jgi:hypothetical protein